MNNKWQSIKDIAFCVKFSIATVSYIINGKAEEKDISDEVIKKVLDYIKKTNYKPIRVAQSLRTGLSKTIVFMDENIISNYFPASLLKKGIW